MLVPAVRILALTAPWRADALWTLGIIMTLPFGGSSTNDAGTGTPRSAYDWNGVVGTGQSLSVVLLSSVTDGSRPDLAHAE